MKFPKSLAVAAFAAAPLFFLGSSHAGPSSSWAHGVDVSEGEGAINWSKAAANGLSFAIVRVSDGTQHPDSRFASNWAGVKAAGMVRGVYQYFRPSENAVAQADLLLSRVGQFEPGDLPPVLDLETSSGQSSATVSAQVNAWCNHIKAQTGMSPMIYTAPGYWNGLANHPSTAGITLWVANWGASSPRMPSGWSDWTFWQNNNHTSVPGLSSADNDYFHGTPSELQAWAASHGYAGSGGSTGGGSTGGGSTGGGSTGGGSTGGGSTSHATLHQGASGAEVTELQQDLSNKGYSTGTIDGVFGPKTKAAVVSFQNDNGLTPDGIVGPLTWAALTH